MNSERTLVAVFSFLLTLLLGCQSDLPVTSVITVEADGLSFPVNKELYGLTIEEIDHGKKSASGRIHDQEELVAAHRTYPFGTFLKVINLANNKSVIVCVTDRGPRQKKRIIDVSASAAEALDFKRQGVTKVRIEVVPDEKERILYELMFPKIPYLETNNSLPLLYDDEE